MPYLKINYDNTTKPTFEALDLPEDSWAWLDACYNAINCTTLATAPTVFEHIVLVIDDEGKLWDGWEDRINKIASILYGTTWDSIVGDAILARVDGENLVPLTSVDIYCLERYFRFNPTATKRLDEILEQLSNTP